MRLFVVAAAMAALLAASGCHNTGPNTHSMVFNVSMSSFSVNGRKIEVGYSWGVQTPNGATDTFDITRGAVVGRLVVTSLVPASDPNDYDAAINVHEDTSGVLYCREYSPYIDAAIIAP